jgi:glutathione/glutaredoxin type arsenate reductase
MKKILFVCVENSCRSQMAEGFARFFGKGSIEIYSAGSKPSGVVNTKAIEVMKEVGIDISGVQSKGFADLGVQHFDYAITLGCGDTCPFIPADKHIEWHIEDPRGRDIEFMRKVRDIIKDKVHAILKETVNSHCNHKKEEL